MKTYSLEIGLSVPERVGSVRWRTLRRINDGPATGAGRVEKQASKPANARIRAAHLSTFQSRYESERSVLTVNY
ncbi:MAG: hypothetical protein ABI478_00055, partial [Propionivibrio sp.]